MSSIEAEQGGRTKSPESFNKKKINVFVAIIAQAFLDACSKTYPGKEQQMGRHIEDAREWLTTYSKCFIITCENAGYHWSRVQRAAKELEARGWPRIKLKKSGALDVELMNSLKLERKEINND